MTADDWKQVEEKLSGVFGSVNLKIDGYNITIQRSLISKNTLANMVYVNGEFQGKWLGEDCEERRRFCCSNSRCFTSKKTIAKYARVFGKKSEIYKNAITVYTYYMPSWNSFKRMKSHFIKNNKSIELVRS